jgi:hypothetical protein
MSEEGEFEKLLRKAMLSKEVSSSSISQENTLRTDDVLAVLDLARKDFPKKEETKVIGSDGEEHSYETYDTETIDCWFSQWFGKAGPSEGDG